MQRLTRDNCKDISLLSGKAEQFSFQMMPEQVAIEITICCYLIDNMIRICSSNNDKKITQQ